MLSIIYPYRDRNIENLKRSLDSLDNQTNQEFEVFFVDYGSRKEFQETVRKLVSNYDFINYTFYPTQDQPWNKSKALNSVIKKLITDFCFVADADMIFHPMFVERAKYLQKDNKGIYFKVSFLEEKDNENASFAHVKEYRESTYEATGLSMFPVKALKELRGFDEFYHFWGAEDTDMHVRLKNAGYNVEFYDEEILLLHQWHPSYRSKLTKKLTESLHVDGIIQLNHKHLEYALKENITKVNPMGWGEVITQDQICKLEKPTFKISLLNNPYEVEDFLYGQLPLISGEVVQIKFEIDDYQKSFKYFAKKYLGKKIPRYIGLKEINDLVLKHIISSYRNKPYSYKIDLPQNQIILCMKL